MKIENKKKKSSCPKVGHTGVSLTYLQPDEEKSLWTSLKGFFSPPLGSFEMLVVKQKKKKGGVGPDQCKVKTLW